MSINAQPFNPTFKLVGNLVEDQVLVYDSSENAFVNSTNTGGGAGAGFDAAVNEGTGLGVWKGSAGTTLQFKTLLGGSDITITESGDSLIIASTVTETMQTGTNLGTGTGIFDSKDGTTHALKFKSLAVGAGLTLTDDGAGTLTLVNTIAAGTSDADLTLSNLSDNATARTNLGVYSKTESDAKYHKHDDAFVPSANNTFDIGSSTLKYNDIYAETFQGTAVLADNLTTSGTTGQVLTYNGSSWAAADPTGSTLEALSNVSNVAPQADQHLTWNAITNLWTPSSQSAGSGGYQDSDARNAISVSGDLSYNATTGVISYTTPTDTDTTYTAGTGLTLTGTVFSNTAPDQTVALTGSGATTITGTYPNFTIASTDTDTDTNTTYTAGTGLTLVGTEFQNTSPDQTVSLTGTGATTVTGTYPNFTIDSTDTNTPTGYNNTNWDTAFAWGDHSTQGYLTSTTAHYTDSDVDTHLNVSGATNNQMLKWTGTDYAWVTSTDTDTTYTAGTNITIDGSNVISATDTNTTYISSDFTHDDLTGYVPLEHIDWTIDQGPTTNVHAGNYIDTNTTYSNLSEFTNDSGYITSTGVLSSHTDVHTSAPSNGDVLKWDAGNSRWAAQADSVGSVTATSTTAFTNKSGAISQWTNDAGYITSASTYSNSDVDTHLNTGTATANQALVWTGTDYDWVTSTDSDTTYTAGTNITIDGSNVISATDTDTTYVSSDFTHDDLTGFVANEHIDWTTSQGATNIHADNYTDTNTTYTNVSEFVNDAGYLTSTTAGHYTDSDVDTHLNTSGAGANQVLSWTGVDYDWITTGAHFDGAFSSLSGTPTTIAGYGITDAFDGAYSSLTGTPTIPSTIDDFADVNITSVSDGQFLKYNNVSGDWENETVTIPTLTSQLTNDAGFLTSETAHYADSDVDSHLNQSNPTSGYVLSWNGSDYAWVSNGTTGAHYTDADARLAISGTTGLSYNNTTGVMALNATIDDLLDVNSTGAALNQVLKWNGTAWSPALDIDTTYTAGTNVAISGSNVISSTDTTYVDSDWNHDNLTGFVANEHIDWTSASAGTIHASNYTDTNTTYTAGANIAISGGNVISATDTNTTYTNVSEFTNDSGYLVSGDLSGYAQTSSLATVATTGAYSDLSGTPSLYANSDVDSHLNQSNPTSGYVLSWNGSDYSWVAQSGGGSGATDKIEEGNSSVEVIDGGANGHVMFNTNGTDRWQVTNGGHILPETNAAYDLGSADKKVRHLFLSNNSLYIEDNTIKTSGTDLLFNDEDVMDYDNLKNKPSIPTQNTGGTGIQVNAGVVSLDANLSNLSNVSSTSPNSGEVLKWDGSEWAPGTDLTSGSSAMNDLSDVDTTGITSGQYLQWNGSAFVASTVSGGGASAIDDLSDVDTTTSSPSNGDVLTWVQADSEWAPAAPSGGSGGGSAVEYFKVNYATNGNLTSITNATSGVSATILSATGGDVEISFSGTNYPPAGILLYGYAYGSNEYVIMPLNKDIQTRKVAGGGSAGSPIAFGTMGSVDLTLKLRENDTGASRSFGTDTHAWIMFTVI